MSSINVTPLTDVLLVLLITFLLSATAFQTSDISQRLPRVLEVKDLEQEATILNVGADGTVAWPFTVENGRTLQQNFARLSAQSTRPTLALAAHRDLEYQRLYPVLRAAQQAGWEQIVLLTEPES